MKNETFASRAKARGNLPIRRTKLGDDDDLHLLRTTTSDERLSMMWQLALDAWAMSGQKIPEYPRNETPGLLILPNNPKPQ
jgi:hypothetical protein